MMELYVYVFSLTIALTPLTHVTVPISFPDHAACQRAHDAVDVQVQKIGGTSVAPIKMISECQRVPFTGVRVELRFLGPQVVP
jgi:hypothetical protein